jgi:hypothetical protein
MKKTTALLSMLLLVTFAKAQLVDKGWYYFKTPSSNLFGLGFNKPKTDKELSYVGSDISVSESDLTVLKGPDESFYADNGWKKIVLTSLFNNSSNISITVKAYKLKRVLMPAKRWQEFDAKNYYIVEGLRADSVFITGKIIKSTETDSKDLEKIISTFATGNTVPFKVIDVLTNKDANVESKGLISYKTGRTDSFAIVIRQPDVYFASKLVQLKSKASKDFWKTPAAHPYENDNQEFSLNGNNQFQLLQHSFQNLHSNGVNLKLSLSYDEVAKTASLIFDEQKVGSPASKPLVIETLKIVDNKPITFDGEYPYLTGPQSGGYSSAEKYLTLIDYKLDFDPVTKKIKVYGFQTVGNQTTYQTCIYQIRNNLKYWPK